jgi:hypothetical protein
MAGSMVSDENNDNMTFPGKIAVVSGEHVMGEFEVHSTDRLVKKYGPDKIVRVTWPEDSITVQDKVIDTIVALTKDREIKVLILNQAFKGSNAAVDKLKETRDDFFIVFCSTHEKSSDAAKRANLLLDSSQVGKGLAIVKQAQKQGAKVFVHYSFPRHMAVPSLAKRRDVIREVCTAESIQFVDVTALDPTGEAGLSGAQQFILDDVPKLVAKYGENTAFFSTNCQLQVPLIKAVIDCHAIYPQPCCPSPYHGFPQVFGINTEECLDNLNHLISEVCRIAEEKNMTDRLSTWPVSATMIFINAGAEYAIKWIRGEVSKENIDEKALLNCMNTYLEDVVGEECCIFLSSYSEEGITYMNYKQVLMSYLDF